MFELFNQCDSRWGSHALGWINPGTICQYGCFNSVLAAIANDSGHAHTPASFDDLCTSRKIFVKDSTGTFDLLPDNALDLLYPGDYTTTHFDGFRADIIAAAVPAPDKYIVLWIYGFSPYWGINILTHFVLGWTADGSLIGDPEGGVARALSAYGGSGNVHKTTLVDHHPAAPARPALPSLPADPNRSLRYPRAIWLPSPNFTADRRDAADPPTQPSYDLKLGYDIVFHSEDGNEVGTDHVFLDPAPTQQGGPRSAHFSVGLDGTVHQFVDTKDCAWHAGNFTENRQSVGIEHEDGGDPTNVVRPMAQLQASADLVAWLEANLGKARAYKRHRDIIATACPGNLPVERIIAIAYPPPPAYSVRVDAAVLAKGLTYDAAVAQAHQFATQRVGVLFAVVDSADKVVDTEFVAPPVGQVGPGTAPIPTVMPAHQWNLIDFVDGILVAIALALKYRGKNQGALRQ